MKVKFTIILAIAITLILTIPLIAQADEPEIKKTGSIEVKISSTPAYNWEGNNTFNGMILNAYQIFHMTGTNETGWTYTIHDDFKGFKYNGLSGNDLIEYIYNLENDYMYEWTDIHNNGNFTLIDNEILDLYYDIF